MVNGDGLVGKVTAVTGGAAQITLITDHASGVSARVLTPVVTDAGTASRASSSRRSAARTTCCSTSSRGGRSILKGDTVVTAGSQSSKLESLFPRRHPDRAVTKVDDDGARRSTSACTSRPFADLRRLDFVQVLTRNGAGGGNERASATP